jgi:hypothetical protein
MSTRTTTELAVAVLRHLSVIDATQTSANADAADISFLQSLYTDKFEELNDMELTYWSADEIPKPIFLAVRDLIANEARGTYGEPMAVDQKEAAEIIILKRIRRHMHQRSSGLSTKAQYF